MSPVFKVIPRIHAEFSARLKVRIVQNKAFLVILRSINRVPLHKPSAMKRFLTNMTIEPTLSLSVCNSMPVILTKQRY